MLFINTWLSYDWFIPFSLLHFHYLHRFLPLCHHHFFFCMLLLAPSFFFAGSIFLFLLFLISCLLASCCPFSCPISRGWTSQGSSQTWSHLRSVSDVVLWSAVMTWPSIYRDVLARRATVSSPMYVIRFSLYSASLICILYHVLRPNKLKQFKTK